MSDSFEHSSEHQPDADEAAGYRRPPVSGRFQKGQSGNSKGRLRGKYRGAPYEAVLGQIVTIRDGAGTSNVTAEEAFLLQLTKRGLEGNGPAARDAMEAIGTAKSERAAETDHVTTIVRVSVMPGSTTTALERLRMARKLDLINGIQRDLLAAMESEKSAVLSTTDEESIRFANEAKRANAQVESARLELHAMVEGDNRSAEVATLESFEATWRDVQAVDKRLLELAVANTNVKASRLAAGDAALAVNQFVDALTAIQAVTKAPETLRELSGAEVAALRIQALLPPHIASASDAEMTQLEAKMHELEQLIEKALADARKSPADAQARTAEAWEAGARYQHLTAEIIRLSRLNTNVLSTDLSVHEKHDVMIAAQTALAALRAEVQNVPRATR